MILFIESEKDGMRMKFYVVCMTLTSFQAEGRRAARSGVLCSIKM